MSTGSGATSALTSEAALSLSTPPPTPARARRLEEYANDYELPASPRHSRESAQSLLSKHERMGSFESFAELQGSSEEVRTGRPNALNSIDEELEGDDDDDELPAKRILNKFAKRSRRAEHADAAEHNAGLSRRRRERNSSFTVEAVGKAKMFIDENRGFLMIALAQGAFAAMNVMVSPLAADLNPHYAFGISC